MAEMLTSRIRRVLDDLRVTDEDACMQFENNIEILSSALVVIEKELKKNNRKVQDHMGIMRNEMHEIEDLLEIWAIEMAAAYMPSKNEKKRGGGITRPRLKWFDNQDPATAIKKMMKAFNQKMTAKATHVNNWLHETFPESYAIADTSNNATQRGNVRIKSVRWHTPRPDYRMEDHSLDMKDVVDGLISLVDEHSVVSIWGVKGLGKTAMARKIYIHPQVRSRFNAFAWVSITRDDPVDSILQDVMNQLGAEVHNRGAEVEQNSGEPENHRLIKYYNLIIQGFQKFKTSDAESREGSEQKVEGVSCVDNIEGANEEESAEEILSQKKCLIVFDGVSGNSQWQQIKSALPFQGTDTRVLITTQYETTIGAEGLSHELRKLTQTEGWQLLQKYVYHHENNAPECGIAPRIGNEIVVKCGGLPSSICSIGRELRRRNSISEWHELNDNFQEYLEMEGKMISDAQRPNKYSVPNYENLSSIAKQCFPYLAIFKEDVDIQDLYLLLVAEGMLSSQQDATEDHIKGLVSSWRRELQMQIRIEELSAFSGRSKRLCLDNQTRELSLCQGEKECFGLMVLDIIDGNCLPIPNETRRLVIHFTKHSSPDHEPYLKVLLHLRSIFFFNHDPECVDLPKKIADLSKYKLLRIVHFVRCKFKDRRLPQGIDNLFNLRYIGLLYCDLDKLPPSISNVKNLLVLNVRAHDDAKITIPNSLSQMVRLQHLRLPKLLVLDQSNKLKLDALLDLETLDGFNADIYDIESLSQLRKLRHLVTRAYNNDSLESFIKFFKPHGDCRVETNLFVEYKCDLISRKGSAILEEVLMCANLYALTLSMVLINRFPNCGKFASKGITQIRLIGCRLDEDPMEALGMFDNLEKLCLGYGAFFGSKMVTTTAGFPNLKYLEFRCLPRLERWQVDKHAMRKLTTLIIKQCPKLKEIPYGLAYVSSLNKFQIEIPTALSPVQKRNYYRTFHFVKEFDISVVDPLSAASSSGAHERG